MYFYIHTKMVLGSLCIVHIPRQSLTHIARSHASLLFPIPLMKLICLLGNDVPCQGLSEFVYAAHNEGAISARATPLEADFHLRLARINGIDWEYTHIYIYMYITGDPGIGRWILAWAPQGRPFVDPRRPFSFSLFLALAKYRSLKGAPS